MRMTESRKFDHVGTIKRLLGTLQASERMHALIIEGPAGWGKTTAVDEAMKLAGVDNAHLGAYSTPLNLFNFLYENSSRFVVIDDVAGLFNESSAMAILKAATWAQGKPRILAWGSTSGKALADEFEFKGKVVVVCNSFPGTADAAAVRSRSFPCKIEIDTALARILLEQAAVDSNWYPNAEKAKSVARFLCKRLSSGSLSQISYRTLQMGYELAVHNSEDWESLLGGMISAGPEDPRMLLRRLAKEEFSLKEQINQFEQVTGFKRRTFFKYRRELKLSGQ